MYCANAVWHGKDSNVCLFIFGFGAPEKSIEQM